MGHGASHDHGLDIFVQSLCPRPERHGGGFGNRRMPDAFGAGEREAGGKSSMLQRVARGRDPDGEECRGGGERIGGQSGLRCGKFSAAAPLDHRGVRSRHGTTGRVQFRGIGSSAQLSGARTSGGFRSRVVAGHSPASTESRGHSGLRLHDRDLGDRSVASPRGRRSARRRNATQF
jgi:hypothetical protein